MEKLAILKKRMSDLVIDISSTWKVKPEHLLSTCNRYEEILNEATCLSEDFRRNLSQHHYELPSIKREIRNAERAKTEKEKFQSFSLAYSRLQSDINDLARVLGIEEQWMDRQ